MREDGESTPISNSTNTNESVHTRRQRIDKNRAIRKDKIKNRSNNAETQTGCLTKEERAHLQKVRNREAAQRSRQMHKEYVKLLQEENLQLKKMLNKNLYCKRCQRQLQTDEQNYEENYLKMQREYCINDSKDNFNEPRIQSLLDFSKIQNEDNSSFIRISNNNSNHENSFGMFLLVSILLFGIFMVTDGIITTPVQIELSPFRRQLMSINSEQNKDKQIKIIDEKLIDKNYQQIPIKYLPAIPQHPIVSISQGQCLESLINESLKSKTTYSTHLRGIHEIDEKNILFCHMPKVYRHNSHEGNIFSRLIEIIVRGSQIMQIITNSPNIEFNKMIQFDGLYRINAQVKNIVEIKDHHCIL